MSGSPEREIEDEMRMMMTAIEDAQLKISQDIVFSSYPASLPRVPSFSKIKDPYRDDVIENGIIQISTDADILRCTINQAIAEIRSTIESCPQASTMYESLRNTEDEVIGMHKLLDDTDLLERIHSQSVDEFCTLSSLLPKVTQLDDLRSKLRECVASVEVLQQHLADREQIIAMYSFPDNGGGPSRR
jgi:hypothetical protein